MAEELLPYVEAIEDLLAPLSAAVESPELAQQILLDLGYAPPSQVLAFRELGVILDAVSDLVTAVRQAIADDDAEEAIEQLLPFLVKAGLAVKGLNDFAAKIQANFAGTQFLVVTDILAAIPGKLVDYLVVKYLEDYHPVVFASLLVAGVVDVEDVDETPTPFNVPYVRRTIEWAGIGALFTDPVKALKDNVDGGDELLYDRLLYLVQQVGLAIGLLPIHGAPSVVQLKALNRGTDLSAIEASDELDTLYFPVIADPTLGVGLDLYPLMDAGTRKYTGLGLALRAGAQITVPLSQAYELQIKASAEVPDGLGLRMERGRDVSFVSKLLSNPADLAASSQLGLRFSIGPTAVGPSGKLLSLGAPGSVLFEIGSGSLAFGIEKQAALDIFVEGDLKDGVLKFGGGGGDGFIASILPAEGISANFNLGLGISNRAGLYFKGSSALSIRLPLHLDLGLLKIDYVGIELGLAGGKFPLSLTTGIASQLGPLAIVIEDIGLRGVFEPKADRSGALGPVDLSFGFKPPKGVGLSIDAGVVKGGGYLFFDFDREEYAGALELTISDFLSLKAIGLITTRMPDGSKGFSLIVIITAEFSPGLQLGYGFTLIGVGGLLGLNRTVVLDALALGVRTGALDGMLFPVDPVANAPRIISDLRTIFPPAQNRFLIGPMAKLGWGTPTLISLALGVIIEIPGNVAILGVLKAILPDEDAALLKLQVNFVGAIEFDKKRGWFFAALFESRIVFITLEGEMGMLIAVGNDANFLLSVGGFHPRFTPPPLPFPSPNRISFDIVNTSAARIRVQGYFAVTTNTVQTGAHAELFFGFDSFSVQGHLAFDALIRFSPFYLIVEISAGASLKAFGVGVFSIDLQFTLEGPTPWRAHGRGSISLWFIEISANFDITWGEVQNTTLQPIAVIPLLQLELGKAANWRALPPPTANLMVSLRKLELDADAIVLHPLGVLELTQNAVPLNLTIDKVGAQKPADARRFAVSAKAGGGLVRRADAMRSFAPAQFRDMTDAQKLAAPAFEDEAGGVQLGVDGAELRSGQAVKRSLRYELTTIDTYYRRFIKRFRGLGDKLFGHFIKGAAIGKGALSQQRKSALQPFNEVVAVVPANYAVVFKVDNKDAASRSFPSHAQAEDWMRSAAANDPGLHARVQIVPSIEMSKAA